MTYEFINELVCHATGGEDAALNAWLYEYAQTRAAWPEFKRACLHWQAADEKLRDAIAAMLGISQPFPCRENPLPPLVASDYKLALEMAEQALAI